MENDRKALLKITRKQTEKQNVVKRAKIILMAGDGHKGKDIAVKMNVPEYVVTTWRKRWLDRSDDSIEERLQDLPRSGAPDTFTPEQVCQLMALACESPEDYGLPITHWTHKELAAEAIRQGIVKNISSHHLGRLLKKKTCNHTVAATG